MMKKLLTMMTVCLIVFVLVLSVRGSGRPADDVKDHAQELIQRYKQGDREAYDLLIGNIDEELFPVYLEALRDTDAKVRRLAIRQLARYKKKEAIAPIGQLLESDANEDVRWEAASRLGQLAYPESGRFLIDALDDDSQRVMKTAIRALGNLKSNEAIEPLKEKLKGDNEKDWEIQRAAAYALWDTTGRGWREWIDEARPNQFGGDEEIYKVRDEEFTYDEVEISIRFLRDFGGLIEDAVSLEELTSNELFYLGVPNTFLLIDGYNLKHNAQLYKVALEQTLMLRKLGEMTDDGVKKAEAAYNEAQSKYDYFLVNSMRSD